MRTLSQRTSRYENDPLLPRQHERPDPLALGRSTVRETVDSFASVTLALRLE
jgi:hypothetical protein